MSHFCADFNADEIYRSFNMAHGINNKGAVGAELLPPTGFQQKI